jgi:hypothetical protein
MEPQAGHKIALNAQVGEILYLAQYKDVVMVKIAREQVYVLPPVKLVNVTHLLRLKFAITAMMMVTELLMKAYPAPPANSRRNNSCCTCLPQS